MSCNTCTIFFVPNYTPYCTAWKKYVILYDETKQIKNVLYELSILFLFEKYLKIDNIFRRTAEKQRSSHSKRKRKLLES